MKLPFKGGYKLTQAYGNNPAYYNQFGFKGHEGIDLIPQDGDWNIYSVDDGVVVQDIDIPRDNYGKYCVVWNKKNKQSWWYCHMEFNNVKIGQKIQQGDLIGKMGSTGQVFGAHLHLGTRKSDSDGNAINLVNGYKGFINPLPYLEELNKEELPCEKELEDMRASRDNWKLKYEQQDEGHTKEIQGKIQHIEELQKTIAEQNNQLQSFSGTQNRYSLDIENLQKKIDDMSSDRALLVESLNQANKENERLSKKLMESQGVIKMQYPEWKILAWRYIRTFLATFLVTFGSSVVGATDINALKALVLSAVSAGVVALGKKLRDEFSEGKVESLFNKIPL